MVDKHFNERDYSQIIDNVYGELRILSYTKPLQEYQSKRLCICLCSCGNEIIVRLSHVLSGQTRSCGHLHKEAGRRHSINLNQEKAYEMRTSVDKPIKTNKTTGIRNISWSNREQKFVVSLKRHGKYFKGRASTLAEAIKMKEEKIKEAEKFFQEQIYKK